MSDYINKMEVQRNVKWRVNFKAGAVRSTFFIKFVMLLRSYDLFIAVGAK